MLVLHFYVLLLAYFFFVHSIYYFPLSVSLYIYNIILYTTYFSNNLICLYLINDIALESMNGLYQVFISMTIIYII